MKLNIANPTAILMSGIMMLRHIGERDAAERIEKAMLAVFAEGKALTRDLGGTAKTDDFAGAIVETMTRFQDHQFRDATKA